MNKDCNPAPSVRKKRVSKKPVSSTALKTAALEEKLDGLVQMLQRSHPALPEITQSQDPIPSQTLGSDIAGSSSTMASGNYNDRINGTLQGYGNYNSSQSPSSMRLESLEKLAQQHGQTTLSRNGEASRQGELGQFPSHAGPLTPASSVCGGFSTGRDKFNFSASQSISPASDAQLKDYLNTYRTSMVPYLPCVCLSPDTTLEEMRSKRPFLLLVISSICIKNLEHQAELVQRVKKILASEMVIEGTKNLDLLLGILVFAGWCHLYICNKPVISTIVHLAMSLASDLGLTKPLPTDSGSHQVMLNYSAQGCPKPITGTVPTRTLEERRAIIGLYLVSSV